MKLTDTQREEILLHYEVGRPLNEIAHDFGVHPVYVRILARRRGVEWKNRKKNWREYLEIEKIIEDRSECHGPSPLTVGTAVAEVTRTDHARNLAPDIPQAAGAGCVIDISRCPTIIAALATLHGSQK